MPGKHFNYIKTKSNNALADFDLARAFEERYQTALLLVLLQRGQLTQRQFDQCLEELKRANRPNPIDEPFSNLV